MCAHEWRFVGRVPVDGRTVRRVGEAKEAVARGFDPQSITTAEALEVGCEQPYRLRCVLCGVDRLARCGRASERACRPCAGRSRARVGVLAGTGLRGGRSGLFVTLTAPSWRPHRIMHKGGRVGPWCRCTGGGASDLAAWNATAGARWNRFVQDVRRETGVDVQYFKGAEVQRRGALHFHVLVKAPGTMPLFLSVAAVRRLALKHGFGHEVDVQPIDSRRHVGYVAKYVSKAAADRPEVPWRGRRRVERVDKATGEMVKGWRPSCRPTYRTWTASRGWGASMRQIRADQQHHVLVLEVLPAWGSGWVLPLEVAGWVPARPRAAVPIVT